MNDRLTLSIDGMHCGACIRRVTNALEQLPGVKLGIVELGFAQLKFTPDQVTPAEIAAAVDRIGFSAYVEK